MTLYLSNPLEGASFAIHRDNIGAGTHGTCAKFVPDEKVAAFDRRTDPSDRAGNAGVAGNSA